MLRGMRISVAALGVMLLVGCARMRPIPAGSVYQTVPQHRPYVELGTVSGSRWAYGAHKNAALNEALDEAKAIGGDALVGARIRTSCWGLALWFIGLIGIPPCGSRALGIAVKWADQPKAEDSP